MKRYLEDGETVYCEGCTLKYDKETNILAFHECEHPMYSNKDGNQVSIDTDGIFCVCIIEYNPTNSTEDEETLINILTGLNRKVDHILSQLQKGK